MSSPGPDIRGAVKARERREVLTYETLRDYVTRVLTEEDRSHFFTKVREAFSTVLGLCRYYYFFVGTGTTIAKCSLIEDLVCQ